jgi:hypothetical protein
LPEIPDSAAADGLLSIIVIGGFLFQQKQTIISAIVNSVRKQQHQEAHSFLFQSPPQ